MSLLGRIFASPESIDKAVDAVISTGDKLVYTQEEKAEMNLKVQDWYLEYLRATQPMNLSRRYITMVVSSIWALFLVAGTLSGVMSHTETSELLFKIMSNNINTPFTVIIGFYFATHMLRGTKK